MKLELTGRTALVTGASKGIGLACAEVLAEEGCHLHLSARNGPALEAAASRLRAAHGIRVSVHVADLGNTAAMEALADVAGDAGILVNNAGAIPSGGLAEVSDAALRAGLDLKLFGYITLTRLLYPRMKAAGGGVIVNIIGNAGESWNAAYFAGSTANAALMSFTKAIGGRSLDDGIRVVGINPGPVATDRMMIPMRAMAQDRLGDAERWRELLGAYPGGRPGTPRECADLVAFLASPRAGYITGTVVTMDGGLAARGAAV